MEETDLSAISDDSLTCPIFGDTSKPHVFTYLNTRPKTIRLTTNNTITVIILAKAFKPVSVVPCLLEVRACDGLLLPAKPLARAGNARLWVKVSLWMDCDKLLWPMLLRVAARSRAYSRSRASNREYLAVMTLLRRLSQGSERRPRCGTTFDMLVMEEAVDDEPDPTFW